MGRADGTLWGEQMAPYFSEKQLTELCEKRRNLVGQYLRLQLRFQARKYKSDRGREYAFHGFGRRLGILVRSIDQVFTVLPPERESIPEREEVLNATIAIQAFVLNIVGCLDNLAWVWVCERAIKAKNGAELSPKSIGLWKNQSEVRASFSSKFRVYLDSREPWFEGIKGFRDSLAHRIPLYIPPYVVRKSNLDEHNRLDQEATAALRRGNHEEHDRLRNDQAKLGEFRPWMTNSLYEQAPTIVFHGQLLSDYATICELGSKMFEELEVCE
jgi:hypothetical protein